MIGEIGKFSVFFETKDCAVVIVKLVRNRTDVEHCALKYSFKMMHHKQNVERRLKEASEPDQSCPWVGLTHGLGWVGLVWVGLGRDFSVFGGLGWIGSTTAKVLKI